MQDHPIPSEDAAEEHASSGDQEAQQMVEAREQQEAQREAEEQAQAEQQAQEWEAA